MRRGVTLVEMMLVMALGAVMIGMVMVILSNATNQGDSFMLDTKINSILKLISDLDKRNPTHSLNFYAQNSDALQAIENKLNIENQKNNFLVHLSKTGSGLDGIHISMENIRPERKWRIIEEKNQDLIEGQMIDMAEKFYDKNITLNNIHNKVVEVDTGDHNIHRYKNTLNLDILESK